RRPREGDQGCPGPRLPELRVEGIDPDEEVGATLAQSAARGIQQGIVLRRAAREIDAQRKTVLPREYALARGAAVVAREREARRARRAVQVGNELADVVDDEITVHAVELPGRPHEHGVAGRLDLLKEPPQRREAA